MQDNNRLSADREIKTGLSIREVERFYHDLSCIYAKDDRWHAGSKRWIERFVSTHLGQYSAPNRGQIVNLGSGGQSYGLSEEDTIHVDLLPKHFRSSQRVLLADIHHLPLPHDSQDVCLCVGSVLNHCDAALVIENIRNVLRPGGKLVLEFETSFSLDLLLSAAFRRPAAPVRCFYQKQHVVLWAFSESYICDLLGHAGFRRLDRESLYHIPPLIYLLFRNSNFAAHFQFLDRFVAKLPIMRRFASNVIYLCQKTSE